MKLMVKSNNQKGVSNMYFVVVGVLITVGVFFAIKYFQDRNNDITIHLPKIEAH